MVNTSQSSLIEAKIIPGKPYSNNGVEIEAGLSWLEIKKHSYNVTQSTNAYFNYAVCKCYFSGN
ncbi:MAG: hypothetical protein SWX82_33800 [Cyanobacteriota bacterium]|nr:hypothetical protein [Cyanobacteriota bacterium]